MPAPIDGDGFQAEIDGRPMVLRSWVGVRMSRVASWRTFEVDEFAVDPEGGAGVGEILPLNAALPDLRPRDSFIQASKALASATGFSRVEMGNFARS